VETFSLRASAISCAARNNDLVNIHCVPPYEYVNLAQLELKPSSTGAVFRPSASSLAYPLPDDALALTRHPIEIPSNDPLGAHSPGAPEFSHFSPKALTKPSSDSLAYPSLPGPAERTGLPDVDTLFASHLSSPDRSPDLGLSENMLAIGAIQQPLLGIFDVAANTTVSTGSMTCSVCGERFSHNFKLK
jgi:hypothetical protein